MSDVPLCETRQQRPPSTTSPPIAWMRSASSTLSGLWSSVRRTALPASPVHSTARESPTCAVTSRPPPSTATRAHAPELPSPSRSHALSVCAKASESAAPTSPRAIAAAVAKCACIEEADAASATAAAHAPPPCPSYRPRNRSDAAAGHATCGAAMRSRASVSSMVGRFPCSSHRPTRVESSGPLRSRHSDPSRPRTTSSKAAHSLARCSRASACGPSSAASGFHPHISIDATLPSPGQGQG